MTSSSVGYTYEGETSYQVYCDGNGEGELLLQHLKHVVNADIGKHKR